MLNHILCPWIVPVLMSMKVVQMELIHMFNSFPVQPPQESSEGL